MSLVLYTLNCLLQVFCSCFAGVYNEYLLKGKGSDIHIMVQNVFMYLDSIVCNCLILTYQGELTGAFTAAMDRHQRKAPSLIYISFLYLYR